MLRAALERDSRTSVLMMTAYGSIETAVEAMRAGAFDFVQKPLDLEQIELRVARAVDHRRLLHEVSELRAERAARHAADEVVAESPALRAALELAGRVAPTRSTVLLTGETGTGKEVIAGLIHRLSPRANGPLVKVNCAALPETLLESELFGHERGAFTGADRQRIGRFEQASGGTLFLDEVGDLSPATQAKLLRVLQDQEFHRLGGTRVLRTDARIVAATNQDLAERIREGRFRRGPLLPAERDPDPPAAAARAARGSAGARPPLPAGVRPRARPARARLHRGCPGAASPPSLARQRPRAAQCDRAGPADVRGPPHPGRGPRALRERSRGGRRRGGVPSCRREE